MVKNDFEEVPLNAASMASSGTHLSPFLRFGCLSPRVMWQRLTETFGKVGCSLGCYLHVTCSNSYYVIFCLFIYLIAFTMITMLKITLGKNIHLNKSQEQEAKVRDTQRREAPN